MPTESGLPGWFPEDFNADSELLSAFEQPAPADSAKYTWQAGDIELMDSEDNGDGKPPDTSSG